MAPLLLVLTACGWWEARQACEAGREEERSAWAALDGVLAEGEVAAAAATDARAEEAHSLDMASGEGAGTANDASPNGAMAQEAYTSASRQGGDAGEAAAAARWADYALQTQAAGQEADRLAERAARGGERIAAWGESYNAAALALALAAGRYEARVRNPTARAELVLSPRLAEELSPLPEDDAEAASLRERAEERLSAFAERKEDFGTVLRAAEKLAYLADRAGQVATTRARDLDYLDFPVSAQVPRAAAASASAAGTRATEAARALNEALAGWKEREEAATVTVPATIAAQLDAARAATAKVAASCPAE